jgi:hypothetical protein
MDNKYSRVELLALVKTYNKINNDKIQNSDKMKKQELLDVCKSMSLIQDTSKITVYNIDLRNLSKNSLIQDIALHFLKQAKEIPFDVNVMKKQDLIDYIELHNITHYTPELLEKEIKMYADEDNAKKVIYYNMIRYDNVNIDDLCTERLVEYIQSNDLDQNMCHFNEYAKLLSTIYNAYDKFCNATSQKSCCDKIKSFPKIIQHLKKLTEK